MSEYHYITTLLACLLFLICTDRDSNHIALRNRTDRLPLAEELEKLSVNLIDMATCQQPLQEGKQLQGQQHLRRRHARPGSLPPPPPPLLGRSSTAARALMVHSEAERRRRERINAHLATLRSMLPDAKQTDKASLLAMVVNQVRELKREATEAATQAAAAATSSTAIPPEANEVTVRCHTGGGGAAYIIRASVCCDDRPGLLADIAGVVQGLRLRPLRADMSTLGGRTQHVLVLCEVEEDDGASGSGSGGGARSSSSSSLVEEAVRQALAKVAFPETTACGGRSRSKRQKLFDSPYYSTVVYSHGW